MERFEKIVNGLTPLTSFWKRSILDVWQGSEYTYGDQCLYDNNIKLRCNSLAFKS